MRNNTRYKQHAQRAFTLVEMIVVVCIMALLAGIAVPVVAAAVRISETNDAQDRMETLAEGINNFYEDTGRFPAKLSQLITISDPIRGWSGPYINRGFNDPKRDVFHDPWLNEIKFTIDGPAKARLTSWGFNITDEAGQGDDITCEIDVTPLLRAKNRRLLQEINTAILMYNENYRFAKLPPERCKANNGKGNDDKTDNGHHYGNDMPDQHTGDNSGNDGTNNNAGGNGNGKNNKNKGGASGDEGNDDNDADAGEEDNPPGHNNDSPGHDVDSPGHNKHGCGEDVKPIPDDPNGIWHTHSYILNGKWTSSTHRHDLELTHSLAALHPDVPCNFGPSPSVLDIPLLGPWPYTLHLLELRGLLNNSDGRYNADAWGRLFVTGPDPVEFVTSDGTR